MKLKKALSILIGTLLLVSLMPAAAFAANGPGGALASIVLRGEMEKCLYSADSTVQAMIADPAPQADDRYNVPEGASYDAAANTLYLTDFQAPGSTLVLTSMGSDFKIQLSGSSTLAAIRSDSMGWGGSITFCGDGALELSSLSEAAIFVNADGAPDFIRVEPQVRLTAATLAGSAVRVANSSLTEGVISFDTATPDVRALDSSGEVRGALTTEGALIDLYTRGGESLYGIEAVIVTVYPDVPESASQENEEIAPAGEAPDTEGDPIVEPVPENDNEIPTVTESVQSAPIEKLAYNVYRLGATDLQGHYEAWIEESEIEDISAYTPYYTPHDFSLYGSDGTLCPRVRFGRFTLSAASNGYGSVSVSPAAVGRGGSALVSYEPLEGYKLERLLINGVSVQAADGKYTIGFVTEDIRIEASFAEAAPVAVELSAPAVTDFKVPADGEEDFVSEPFTAVVRDGAGDAVNLPVSYSLAEETAGVSVDESGRVHVANAFKSAAAEEARAFTVIASLAGTELRGEAGFSVSLDEPRVSHVEILRGDRTISGSDTLTIPSAGHVATASYSTVFTDQYGETIDETASWSSDTTPGGVSLSGGTLTVTEACADESSLALTAAAASNGAVRTTVQLSFSASALEISWPTATLAENPVYGISWEELVTLEGGSATREGSALDGSFTLATQSELPAISDSYCVRFSYTDEDGELQSVESESYPVSLARKTITAEMITLSPSSTPYTGAAVTPGVSLRDGSRALVRDTDFTVGEYQNNTAIGSGSVSVTGIGNYEGTAEASFAITPIPGSAIKSSIRSCKPADPWIEPALTLKYGESELVRDTDYDLSFRYDVPARNGTATVTLKGIYSGTLVLRFDLPDYQIDSGANSRWSKSSADALSFRANGALGKFTELTVDGKTVDPTYYTTESGSTIVRLKAEYLKTLTPGKHIVGVAYQDGKALTIFSVTDAVRRGVPTGDENNMRLWLTLLGASAAALVVLGALLLRLKKKTKKRKRKH